LDPIATINSALSTVARVTDYFKSNVAGHVTDNSLTQLTKLTRAEPMTLISQDCANLEYLPSLLNTMTSIYAGYFLQAVAMMTTAVRNIEVVRVLDALNPNRDSTGYLLQGRHDAVQNDVTKFLISEGMKFSLPTKRILAAEGAEIARQQDTIKVVYELENLAVGKLINVDIDVPNTLPDARSPVCSVTIPITIRLAPYIVNNDSLSYIFTHRKEQQSLVERYHSWRSGRISLIKDMIFCQDLIDEYRRAALKDKSGALQEMTRRVNANRGYGLLTKNPSLAISTNLYVISSDAAEAIEAKLGFRFNSKDGREKIFEGTYAMIIAVVDTEREIINFYFNGIAQPSTISVRSLKASSNKKGPDIGDIMRVLLEGRAPTF
jgi:hypothetical protein